MTRILIISIDWNKAKDFTGWHLTFICPGAIEIPAKLPGSFELIDKN